MSHPMEDLECLSISLETPMVVAGRSHPFPLSVEVALTICRTIDRSGRPRLPLRTKSKH